MIKRVGILAGALIVIATIIGLLAYDVIKIDFIGFMEIQPAFNAMENPLPVPENSIPIEGAAYIPGLGAPDNPIEADEVSVERGRVLFSVNCTQCHGPTGEGNGPIAPFLVNKKPANLTSQVTQDKSDGTLFVTISAGLPGAMPALNENLSVRDRWDVVNYLRTLTPSR
ncbi:MAG: cytochrome c [Anaerolineales bacterium]|jgi:mono/diheme cytochrome c family protein